MKEKAQDALEAAYEKGKELVKNEVASALPKLEEKLESIAEKKLVEREAKDLATIDQQLALLPVTDPSTGLTVTKKWQDFDGDHDGHISAGEGLRIQAFVTVEGGKRVAAGSMSKDTFLGMEKTTGIATTSSFATGAAVLAIANRRKRNGTAPTQTAGGGDPPPPPPKPSTPPAAAPPKPA